MPSALTLGAFALASFALIVVPGPNLVYIVTRSITQGTRAGLASAAGVETGTFVYVLASVVGVSAMISESKVAFNAILYAGAAYLVYLAVQTLRHPPGVQMDAGAVPAKPLARIYLDATVVNLLNPKVALFFVAFLPQFLAPSDDAGAIPVQLIIFGALFFVIALALDIGYALLGGTAGRWLRQRGGQITWMRWPVFAIYLGLAAFAVLG